MLTSRRMFSLGALASVLAGCGGRGGGTVMAGPAAAPGMQAVANPAYDAWVAGFQRRAANAGITQATLDRAFARAGFLPDVVERDRNQTEFTRTLEEYLAIAASEERIAKGRANYARYRDTLARIEARYGVEAHVVTAVWGLESMFGERRGDVPVISALSTLAFDGRRGAFFESQLIGALRILQSGDITPDRMTGSWAGAMGHTQFIPTSYLEYAVDFTGDGRRDIWGEDPTDALASTAAYLARSGWRQGQPWGGEVGSPGAAAGTRRLTPQPSGPTFAVGPNFNAIKRYNNSDSYAIGVGHLSDRIIGAGPIRGSFPPDRYGLTGDTRKELQQRLTTAGFDTQGADGVLGANSRAAITAYQQRNGLAVTGEPSLDLLLRLRG
ncbi:peptidoglycan-binding protein [Loktanella sp. 3ANDIMAR09]|uniref:lytic murein transglycosylase n=1 Tax=Loktanella sp. 3ANDIMAR09 TaxID=1225657 RepID=UPI0007001A77|nr:lytic murein transglycosylase [Loktanella sp. 3ANDIMAR09]KQI69415.1 peptidoglycan-binding protein [Loktanella sp. 3ANDIMAR09]